MVIIVQFGTNCKTGHLFPILRCLSMDSRDTKWLSTQEQEFWRGYLASYRKLISALDLDLQNRAQLTFAEYEVLVHLSEAEGNRLRMSQLAEAVLVSRSGLTRRVDQMVSTGLVSKGECPEDRRGIFAGITPQGLSALEKAAPIHVEGVRRYLIQGLGEREIKRLSAIFFDVQLRLETPSS